VERAIFDALLEAGADVDLQEDQGLTPVMLAVRKLSKQKAQWLIGG
jgi:ankyrin repeat protein